MKLIEVRNLKKTYKNLEAVGGINFELKAGEILGFLGPNGAGKSTTISMLASLANPSSGDIYLNGTSILKNPQPLREMLGVVPQDIALYPEFSGYENLEFFGRVYGLRGKQLKTRINEVLEIIGLTDRASERIEHYSGGMKRRINIGAALLHQPQILIMDEPTVGIDPQSRKHILETVKELNRQGMTIIYTSHYMEEVEFLCDRIYIMDHGKIIASGGKEELKDLVSTKDTINMVVKLGNPLFKLAIEQLELVEGVYETDNEYRIIAQKNSQILSEVFRLAAAQQVEIISVDIKTPTLEDVFLHLTGRGLRN